MIIVEIEKLYNGAHRNQITPLSFIPDGYAVIPDDMDTPNFPFGEIEYKEIDGVMTVTKWTAGEIPEPAPEPKPEATTDDVLNALIGYEEVAK